MRGSACHFGRTPGAMGGFIRLSGRQINPTPRGRFATGRPSLTSHRIDSTPSRPSRSLGNALERAVDGLRIETLDSGTKGRKGTEEVQSFPPYYPPLPFARMAETRDSTLCISM